ncbi:uncharacterized protein LOC133795982 [Humulus lupulus]|uniref:uncharacterized protein LOC133795982 n=1 Tax=Humulus lupulus TaxID=3486 RepID=UPI002B411AAC|nr:uncharacterized protein LOC133795982 [Humulus lupulus]
MLREGKLIAQVDLEEIEVEAYFWSLALVCVVLGANPPFSVFEGFIKRLWGKLGIERIARMNAGYTIVKFWDEATRDLVLETGVVHFDRKPIILRPWSTDLDTLKLVKSVPVWIRLPDLGLQYWGVKCLSALVSTIGKPILIDKVTKDRSMVKFARVLVDMEISENFPKTISFLNERGQLMDQIIEYEWQPTQCSCCKALGHYVAFCKRKQEGVWRKKEVIQGPVNSDETPIAAVETLDKSGTKETSNSDTVISVKKNGPDIEEVVTRSSSGGNKTGIDFYQHTQWRVGIGAFLETKLRGNKVEEFMMSVFRGWEYYTSSVCEGRLLLVWHPGFVSINILQINLQFIHSQVTFKDSSQPWLMAGDFNAVFDYDDRIGGRTITEFEMTDAQQWRALGLADEMRSIGSRYTWTNNQEAGARIFSKVDRVFKNEAWMDMFPNSEALTNWDSISDHWYCLIKSAATELLGVKPFRFYNMWTEHKDFRSVVLSSWYKPLHAPGLFCIKRKLDRLKHVLRKFNKEAIGDVTINFSAAKD